RQTPVKVAAHDLDAGLGDLVDALQGATPDEEPDRQRAQAHHAESGHEGVAHDHAEALGLAEVAADEHDQLVGQAKHDRDRRMRSLVGLPGAAQGPGTIALAFAEALVDERPLGPALDLEHARLEALDVAGKDAAVSIGDQIEV